MAYDDLRAWIAALDRAGELKKIRTEVDPILEITEIADRVSKSKGESSPFVTSKHRGGAGGHALLFQNIKGHRGSQVLINQFGSARRMNLALEVDALDEVAERIRGFMDVKSPQGFLDKVKMLPMLAEMGKFFPKTVATGPCKEVIKRENFSLWIFLSCNVGQRMPDALLPCRAWSRATPKLASATSVCIECRYTTSRPPACTGNARKSAPNTTANACGGCSGKSAAVDMMARVVGRLGLGGNRPAFRQNGSRRCHRHRSGDDFFCHRSRAARCRGIFDRRIPAPETSRAGEVRDRRS